MKLSDWATSRGLNYQTAWRMWKMGQSARTGGAAADWVIVQVPSAVPDEGVARYARVSSADRRADLDRRLARLVEF